MAENKKPSQAERAAAGSRRNKASKIDNKTTAQDPVHIPARLLASVICLALLLFSLLMLFEMDGILPNFCYRLIVGLIGRTGFYFSIPALIYLFCIMAFSGKSPVMLRSISVLFFVFFAMHIL